jgi:serine phosphatase RsbU (regulator of sigma subunit)
MTAAGDPGRLEAVRATGLLDTPADEAFDRLTRLAAVLLRVPYAFVTLVDDRRSFWKSCYGIESTDPADRQNTLEESFCQYVVASGEELIVSDTAQDPRTAGNPSIESMGVAAWAGFPLFSTSGHVLGTFCAVDTVAREWTEHDVFVLQTLSSAAAGELALREAAAGARVAAAARELANERLALLAQVGQDLTEALDIEEGVARLARLVVPMLGDWSIVSVLDADGTLRDLASWHVDSALRPTVATYAATRFDGRPDRGPIGEALESAMPIATTGVAARAIAALASPAAIAAITVLAPHTSLAVPLTAHGRAVGALSLCRGVDRPPMSDVEIDLAVAIAHRAALALDNMRLYAQQREVNGRLHDANQRLRRVAVHERTVARALQDALLTRLPEPDHLHLVARYLTASGTEQVGGDWYDAVVLPTGSTVLVIGDVTGHDIRAAAVMGQLRSMLRAFAWDHDETPSQTLSRVDRASRELGVDTIASVALARIEQSESDRETGVRTVRWSSAGHPPPILLHADGHAELLTGDNDLLLGVLPGVQRRDNLQTIPISSTLLLYTDGLIETREQDLDHGIARLLESLRAHHKLTPDDLLDALLAEMVGSQPSDDVAVLAVRFNPQDRPRPVEAGPEHL